jgi:hypothetical protein
LKLKQRIIELCGYGGMLCILGAYLAVSFGWLGAEGFLYQSLNLVGSAGNIVYYRAKRAYSGEILDGVWALVALLALVRLLKLWL